MKDDLKDVLNKGKEFANEAGNAFKKLGDEVYDKSKVYFDKGVKKTNEIDKDVRDFVKYHKSGKVSVDDIMNRINELSDDEKKEIINRLKEEVN